MSEKEIKSDLIDYLNKDGAKEISPDNPYNDTDALVLSYMAYLNLEYSEVKPKGKTIAAYMKAYKKVDPYVASKDNEKALVEALANNPRYKDLELSNIEAHFSNDEPEQFAGMTVTLPDNGSGTEKIAVFRGTDSHITSWWEDGRFACYRDPDGTRAQSMAVDYINKMNDVDKLYLAGHSKGGGEGEWAALFCNDEIRSKIVSIISLDGPGLRKDIKAENKETYDALRTQLGNNWYTIAPVDSFVGFLMTDPEKVKIVGSTASTFGQHTGYSWMFKEGQLDSGEINTREPSLFSKVLNNIIDDSLKTIPKPVLQRTIDSTARVINNLKNGTLDDEIIKHFDEYKDIVDKIDDEDGFFNVLKNVIKADYKFRKKIYTDMSDAAITAASDIYTIRAACEATILNIEITAVEYAGKKIDEGIEYIKESADNGIKYLSNEFENTREKMSNWVNNAWSQYFDRKPVYRKMGNVYVEGGAAAYFDLNPSDDIIEELIVDDDVKSESYNINPINLVCIISGLQLVQYGVAYFKDKEVGEVEKEKYVDCISKYIKDIMENTKQWESAISLIEVDKMEETNKFLKTVNDISTNMSKYISGFLGIGSSILGSSFQQQSIKCATASGEVGLEFYLIPRINNIINEVVDNYNVSTEDNLDDIISKLSQLRYTSFSIREQVEVCKDSLEKQKRSLYDFRDSLEQYDSRVKEMEQAIIGELNKIELDCKIV